MDVDVEQYFRVVREHDRDAARGEQIRKAAFFVERAEKCERSPTSVRFGCLDRRDELGRIARRLLSNLSGVEADALRGRLDAMEDLR